MDPLWAADPPASLHDLLRSYAAELCAETDPDDDRDAATSRLLSHYLHSAHHSHLLLQPHQRLPSLEPEAGGAAPEQPDGYAGALARIPAGACFHLGDSSAALAELERARDLLARLGLPAERAYLQSNFGSVLSRLGRHEEAIIHHRRALELYRAADLRIGEAYVMAGIGSCANRLGQPGRAIASIAAAMDIHTELGDAYGSASSWQSDIQRGAGDPAAARASFQQALAIFGELRLPQAEEVRGRLAALTRPGRSLLA